MFLKSLAAFLSAVLFSTNCAFAHLPETNFWKERQKATAPQKAPTQLASLPVSRQGIFNSQFGTIRKVLKPTAQSPQPRVVIHIQDIHLNKEAQQNIGKTVRALMDSKQVGLVALEGAFAPIDFTSFQKLPYQSSVRKAANFLLKENMISGPIHAALSDLQDIPAFIGIDDEAHYNANVEAYRSSAHLIKTCKTELEQAARELKEKKLSVFNSQLSVFDKKVEAYRDGKIGLGEFIQILNPRTAVCRKFSQALEIEKSLDFSRARAERASLLNEFLPKLNATQTAELANQSLLSSQGQLGQKEFYVTLLEFCEKAGVSLQKFPMINTYMRYVSLADDTDVEALLRDVIDQEKLVYATLARTAEEKRLIEESRRLYLTQKLVDFSLSKEEWDEYKKVRSTEYEVQFESFESFYREAEIRDRKMADNLVMEMRRTSYPVRTGHVPSSLKSIERDVPRTSILVTGGFHSSGIDKKLVDAGFTVVTFVPKITKIDSENGSAYLSVFTREKTPLEKLFEGQKLFLAGNPFPDGARHGEEIVAKADAQGGTSVPDGIHLSYGWDNEITFVQVAKAAAAMTVVTLVTQIMISCDKIFWPTLFGLTVKVLLLLYRRGSDTAERRGVALIGTLSVLFCVGLLAAFPPLTTVNAEFISGSHAAASVVGGIVGLPIDGGNWLAKFHPNLVGKNIIEVGMESSLMPEHFEEIAAWVKAQQDAGLDPDEICRRAAMSQSVGGIGPLLPERMIAMSQHGASVLGVVPLYEHVYMQHVDRSNGTLGLDAKVKVGDYIRAIAPPETDAKGQPITLSITMFDGRRVQVIPRVLRYGPRAKILFLDAANDRDIFDVAYPGKPDLQQRFPDHQVHWETEMMKHRQAFLLGRGTLACAKALNFRPDIINHSESWTAYAYPQLVDDENFGNQFSKDPFFRRTKTVYNDHTPVLYSHLLVDRRMLDILRINPKYHVNQPVWVEADGRDVEPAKFHGPMPPPGDNYMVDLTKVLVLASRGTFGVSKIHAMVLRAMNIFQDVAGLIRHITNGVLRDRWQAVEFQDSRLLASMTDEEIIGAKDALKDRLLQHLEKRQEKDEGWINRVRQLALVMFDRRITDYKRFDLVVEMLTKPELLAEFLESNTMLVLGGRIHQNDPWSQALGRVIIHILYGDANRLGEIDHLPNLDPVNNMPGLSLQELKKNLQRLSEHPDLLKNIRDRVLFYENYNVWEAPIMVQGVDAAIMLSDKGREASATGFQKVQMNGGIIIAVEDGAIGESVRFFQKDTYGTALKDIKGADSPEIWAAYEQVVASGGKGKGPVHVYREAVGNGILVDYFGSNAKSIGDNQGPRSIDLVDALCALGRIHEGKNPMGEDDPHIRPAMIRNALQATDQVSVVRTAQDNLRFYSEMLTRDEDQLNSYRDGWGFGQDVAQDYDGIKEAIEKLPKQSFVWMRANTNPHEPNLVRKTDRPGIKAFLEEFEQIVMMGWVGMESIVYHGTHRARPDFIVYVGELFKDNSLLAKNKTINRELAKYERDILGSATKIRRIELSIQGLRESLSDRSDPYVSGTQEQLNTAENRLVREKQQLVNHVFGFMGFLDGLVSDEGKAIGLDPSELNDPMTPQAVPGASGMWIGTNLSFWDIAIHEGLRMLMWVLPVIVALFFTMPTATPLMWKWTALTAGGLVVGEGYIHRIHKKYGVYLPGFSKAVFSPAIISAAKDVARDSLLGIPLIAAGVLMQDAMGFFLIAAGLMMATLPHAQENKNRERAFNAVLSAHEIDLAKGVRAVESIQDPVQRVEGFIQMAQVESLGLEHYSPERARLNLFATSMRPGPTQIFLARAAAWGRRNFRLDLLGSMLKDGDHALLVSNSITPQDLKNEIIAVREIIGESGELLVVLNANNAALKEDKEVGKMKAKFILEQELDSPHAIEQKILKPAKDAGKVLKLLLHAGSFTPNEWLRTLIELNRLGDYRKMIRTILVNTITAESTAVEVTIRDMKALMVFLQQA